MIIARLENIEQYLEFREKTQLQFDKIWRDEQALIPADRSPFSIRGISYPAKELVDFHVDFEYSDGVQVNWRERLICPKTNFNNRLRACIHFAEFELAIQHYHKIYITEQVTPLFQYFKENFPQTTGSEFLDPDLQSGSLVNNIRHEDMTRLSFNDEEFDFYLSFECFEHIPDFTQAFHEAFRILKKEGTLFFTVPFMTEKYENIIRAYITSSGEICHILPPEYHGDPVNANGVLCFTYLGWQMLDILREVGFKKVYAIIYWSDAFGYLGGQQILFIAKKF